MKFVWFMRNLLNELFFLHALLFILSLLSVHFLKRHRVLYSYKIRCYRYELNCFSPFSIIGLCRMIDTFILPSMIMHWVKGWINFVSTWFIVVFSLSTPLTLVGGHCFLCPDLQHLWAAVLFQNVRKWVYLLENRPFYGFETTDCRAKWLIFWCISIKTRASQLLLMCQGVQVECQGQWASCHTIEPVLKDHLIDHKNVASRNRLSLATSSDIFKQLFI